MFTLRSKVRELSTITTSMAQMIRAPLEAAIHYQSAFPPLLSKHAFAKSSVHQSQRLCQSSPISYCQPLPQFCVPLASLSDELPLFTPQHTHRMHIRSAVARPHQKDTSTSCASSAVTVDPPRSCSAEYQESRHAILDQQAEMNHRVGSIHLVMGPMFSGKTTELLRRIRWEVAQGSKVAVIKSATDTRYAVSDVVSHDGERMPCIALNSIHTLREQLGEDVYNDLDVIGIDEGQFIKGLKGFCEEAADRDGKAIVIAGLDGDFRREIFGDLVNLIPLADTITKLAAKCLADDCGRRALYSLRKTASTDKELVGGADVYMPVCRHHYLQLEHFKRVVDFGVDVKANEGEGKKMSTNH